MTPTALKHIILASLAALTFPTLAQHSHTGHGSTQHAPAPIEHSAMQHAGHAPYSGFQTREIKALSEPQLAELRSGKGMSLALPAELNGYPGPSHTLELAAPLQLTPAQREQTQQIFTSMQKEAQVLG